MFLRSWDECIELQQQPKVLWLERTVAVMASISRWEITAHAGSAVVGAIIVGHDDDVHVGPCLSVFAQYVLPEFRLQGASQRMMSTAVRIARQSGANTFAYTHRLGPWRYETIYRRLK